MERQEKLNKLESLLRLKRIERMEKKLPNYWLNKEISDLKKELGLASRHPHIKKHKKPRDKKLKKPVHYPEVQGCRIAVDVAVGYRAIAFLNRMGINVIVRAEPAEPDSSWLKRAFENDVEIIVSDDLEVQAAAKINGLIAISSAGKDPNGYNLYTNIVGEILDSLEKTK